MIRNFNPVTERFLTNLALSQKRSAKNMEEISSGYRANKASDAPDDVVSILRIQSDVHRTTQVQNNLSRLSNEVNSAEATLQIAITLTDRANVLAAQSLNVAQTPESLATIETQVQDLLKQMVGLTQLNIQGRYVFSGDNDSAPQYQLDPVNLVTGVQRMFVTSETRQIGDAFGTTFTAAVTAQDIFDHRDSTDAPTSNNVFAAFQQLINGLNSGDTSVIEQAIESIKSAGSWLNRNLSFYGAVQRRIQDSTAVASKYQTQWTMDLGEKRDADQVAAISDLEAISTQQAAAMAAQARFAPRSLFDFLK